MAAKLERSSTASRHFQVTPANPAATDSRSSPASAAGSGWRRHHIQARVAAPTGRAAIGSPVSQRARSSARAWALGIAPLGVLLQALQADDLQVARDPGVARRRGLGRHSADLVERPRRSVLPAWGAWPVSKA